MLSRSDQHEEHDAMADPEQVERLTRGVQEWNKWRQEHPEIRPDLSNVDLSNADLVGANLDGVDLSSAKLSGIHLERARLSGASLDNVDLSGAKLFRASLHGANLSEASLGGADLSSADLRSADLYRATLDRANLGNTNLSYARLIRTNLSGAKLISSDLWRADLSNANLSNADLTEAHFHYTIFAEVDLSNVKGLETTIYFGRSFVDINTVILPKDETTRLSFLRGVGFTETQIEYLPSLLTYQPIQYHSLFISYASQDEVLAKHLHTNLRRSDVPCWFAPHDLQPGNYFRERIDQAIHTQDKLLLLLSEHSVKSGWVRYEVELALARENRLQREILFPIRLDDTIFDCTANWAISLLATRHIGDFTNWQDDTTYQQAFSTLLRHLTVRPFA